MVLGMICGRIFERGRRNYGYKPNCACNTGLKFQTFLAQLPEEGKANTSQEVAQILDAFLGKLLSKNLAVVILFSPDFKAYLNLLKSQVCIEE